LCANGLVLDVDFDYLVQARAVDVYAFVDGNGPASHPREPAARGHRYPVLVGDFHGLDDIRSLARTDDHVRRENLVLCPGRPIRPENEALEILGQDLIALLLHHPEYIETVREKLHFDDFNSEALGKIYSLILTIYKTHGTISESALIEMADNKTLSELISSLAKVPIPEQQRSKFIDDYVNTLLKFKVDQRIKDLKSELKIIEKQGNPEKASELAAEIEELITRRGE